MNTDNIYSDAVASLMDLRDLFEETQEDDWYEKIQKMMDDISDKWEGYERHERAVERKLDEIIKLLEIQTRVLTGLAFTEMMEDEE